MWYCQSPVGINTIAGFLKSISIDSGSSTAYTNHSIKATIVTVLKKAGYQPVDIMAVMGHRNVASLAS